MDELESLLERAFPGCRLLDSVALRGGVSARATRCTVQLPGGHARHVVVRRPPPPGRVTSEQRILSVALAAGIPVPAPLYVEEHSNALVLDFVDGQPDFAPPDLEFALRTMAETLASIHRVRPETADLSFLPLRSETVHAMVTERPAKLDAALDEGRLRAVLDELWPWPQTNPSVLLHGDYWPGNMLWHEGHLRAVLDWEDSEVGDPLADVALARLDLCWAFGAEAADTFTRHYASSTHVDWRRLPHWDLCIALRPMSNVARWATSYPAPPIDRPDIDEASMTRGHHDFVQRALALLRP